VADERPLHERLLDLAVYVPIGIAASVVEELPNLAEKGRLRFRGQLELARMLGKFAVAEAQRRAGKPAAAREPSPASSPPRAATAPPAPPPRAATAPPSTGAPASTAGPGPSTASPVSSAAQPGRTAPPPAAPPRPKAPARNGAGSSKSGKVSAPGAPGTGASSPRSASPTGAQGAAAAPEVSSLPIPGYDTLAASQVVQRLASLRPDELDAVRRYEVATRGRRTILHRIGQLTTSDGRASA
jgi:hypothetical protein